MTETTQAQLAMTARSADRLARARTYANRLDIHAAELRGKLDTAAGDDTAGPLRGELIEIDRQRRQATALLFEVQAEHDRHAADLRACYGDDGQARAVLKARQADKDAAQAEVDQAADILARARVHIGDVESRLARARAEEAQHDAEAGARLHEALRDGAELPTTAAPLARASTGLNDDARAARAAEARAAAEHGNRARAMAEAERQVAGAADMVMSSEADAMAREAAALHARADILRTRLAAYSNRTRADYVAPVSPAPDITRNAWSPVPASRSMAAAPRVTVTPIIAAALVAPAGVQQPSRDLSRDASDWTVFATALLTNADAESAFATALPPTLKSLPFAPADAA